jgi:hypothetical protein
MRCSSGFGSALKVHSLGRRRTREKPIHTDRLVYGYIGLLRSGSFFYQFCFSPERHLMRRLVSCVSRGIEVHILSHRRGGLLDRGTNLLACIHRFCLCIFTGCSCSFILLPKGNNVYAPIIFFTMPRWWGAISSMTSSPSQYLNHSCNGRF